MVNVVITFSEKVEKKMLNALGKIKYYILCILHIVFYVTLTNNAIAAYQISEHNPFIIQNINILTGEGTLIRNGSVVVKDGRIVAIDASAFAPDLEMIDGQSMWLTPGFILMNVNIGRYPNAAKKTSQELGSFDRSQYWLDDPTFVQAIKGGVTTMQIFPAEKHGKVKQGYTVKNIFGRTMQHKLVDTNNKHAKLICPSSKRVTTQYFGDDDSFDKASIQDYKYSLLQANAYHMKGKKTAQHELNTFIDVLKHKTNLHVECASAKEIHGMMELAAFFNLRIKSFHQAMEAYQVSDFIGSHGSCIGIDPLLLGNDFITGVNESLVLLSKRGNCTFLQLNNNLFYTSLHHVMTQAASYGNRIGFSFSAKDAVQWLTLNPAKALGMDSEIGSIKEGKQADLVLWTAHPFSAKAQVDRVIIGGQVYFDRNRDQLQPQSNYQRMQK